MKKELQKRFNKLEIKIESDNNNKIYKKLDINTNNQNTNKRKNMIYTKSTESKNKILTTESLFKSKNTNNYQPVNNKKSNSNPFRNSLKRSIENSCKKKESVLSINKIAQTNLLLNSSESKIEKNRYSKKILKNDIKNINIDLNENSLKSKKNIYENQIKNININEIEKYLRVREQNNSKRISENRKTFNNYIRRNGKDEYIIFISNHNYY